MLGKNLINWLRLGSGNQLAKPPLSTDGQTKTTVSSADTDNLRTEILQDGSRVEHSRRLKPLGPAIYDEPTEGSEQPSDLIPLTDRTLAVAPDETKSENS